jgi:hypothetical protein
MVESRERLGEQCAQHVLEQEPRHADRDRSDDQQTRQALVGRVSVPVESVV